MIERSPIDQELHAMMDKTVLEHQEAYVDLFNFYGFLMTSFLVGVDGATVTIDVNLDGRAYEVDTADVFRHTIPAIIGVEAQRLTDMGEMDYVLAVNEMMHEKWGKK